MRKLRYFTLVALLLSLALLAWTNPAQAAPLTEGDAPQALNKPADINCRPVGNKTDQVVVRWKETNNGAADYKVYRRATSANSWSLLDTIQPASCDGDDICAYTDASANNSTVYRYRVDADDGNQPVVQSDVCREPLWVDSSGGNYRTFFRLQECPTVDGKQICTQDISVPSPNKHAVQLNETHEDYRDEFMGLGFNDPGTYDGGKPFPIDLYYCNNGCANSNGIQIPPANMEGTDYDPATGTGTSYEIFVVGHEAFHKVQGSHGGGGGDPDYKWLIEGQARSSEDKSCIFPAQADCTLWDDQDLKYYAGQVRSYLGKPEQALLKASYNAALFWTYVTEQFGTSTTEPQRGMDFMLKFWEKNEALNASKDGINTLNDTLTDLQPATSRRFKDIFQDFAVANYAKDYITTPVPNNLLQYNYVDEETYPGLSYGPVKKTLTGTLQLNEIIVDLSSVDAWGTRYFEVDPDPALPVITIEVEALAGTSHELYFHVLAIKNGAIADQWSDLGTEFELNVNNGPGYDRLALVVASMGKAVNFQYGFNLADGLFILSPTTQFKAKVGEATSPKKFILELQVLDGEGDPVAGIDSEEFTITVDGQVISPPANPADDPIVGSSYIAGRYWLVVRAPDNPGCDPCDLSVAYTAAYTDTEVAALDYGPVPDTDNMIIIDRSGSMAGAKIDAAKEAGRLYVDSYSTGDRVGVLSFAASPNEEYPLTGWSDPARAAAQTAINSIAAPAGQTAVGAALREGQQELIDQGSPNPAWAMVLLSDGEDTVDDTKDHIPEFLKEYKASVKDGDQVPVIHVVAVGDDADGVALESVAQEGQGLLQWLPEPTTLAASDTDATSAIDTEFYGTLSEIYRVFAEDVLDEQQIYARRVISTELKPFVASIPVDAAASEAIFVVKYYPTNANEPFIQLRRPAPANTVVVPTLQSAGQKLWRLPAPEAGDWTLTLRGVNTPPDVILLEAALVSDLILEGFLGLPPEERIVGKIMPVLAHLSDIAPLPGATVKATSERTGEVITLHDDGLHGDGAKDDGFYAGLLTKTNQPGGYPLIIDADGTSPFAGKYTRRTRLSFYLAGAPDGDEDRIPDWWEDEYPCMDPKKNDASADYDVDKLPNAQEFERKTNPCDADTDDGGEPDGFEVSGGRDPLWAPDDGGSAPPTGVAWPGVGRVVLKFTPGRVVDIYRGPSPQGPFTMVAGGEANGEWVDSGVENGMQYCYLVMAVGRNPSPPSDPTCTTPKLDPHPPHGFVVVQQSSFGAGAVTVQLMLDASDNAKEEEHPPFDGQLLTPDDQQTGVSEMMISNRADFEGAVWEPYGTSKDWEVGQDANNKATVFVMFRDGAGNQSEVVAGTIDIDSAPQPAQQTLFLPTLRK